MRHLVDSLLIATLAIAVAGPQTNAEMRGHHVARPTAALPSGLGARWLLDEGTGSTISDASGNGNGGQVSGATWVPGHSGSALHFDGTDDRAVVTDSASLHPRSVTVSAWIRADGSPGAWRVFLFKGVTDCVASSYSLKSSGSGGLVFGVSDGSTNVFSPDAGSGVWDGDWHIVTGSYDGAHVRLYVDGLLIGSTAASLAIDYDLADGSDLVIGHPVNGCDQASQFTGDIDDVRIWDRALSGSEISTLGDETVDVTDVTLSRSTFYPVKDGYRDAVTISGRLLEPATVRIQVRDSKGHTVRSFSVARTSGRYSRVWDGRRSSGSIVAAGKYQVRSTFRDDAGNTRTVSRSVTVSSKRLVWRTASQTRNGDRFSRVGATSYADVNTWACNYPHCVYLFGNLYDELAYARYQFTVPKAVKYGSFTFASLGAVHHPGVTDGPATLSLMNWARGHDDGLRRTGKRYAWYSTKVAGASHVSSRHQVRAWVTAYGLDAGNWDVAKVKLSYRYAILK